MDWIRLAQGLVFLGASFLVIVVGMRGIDPDSIALWVVYLALYLEAGMLVLLASLFILLQNGEPNKTKELRTTIEEIDSALKSVVENLNAQAHTNNVPPATMDQLSEIRGKVGYMKGIVH